MRLRYYGDHYDEERHGATVDLLGRVRVETDLAVEIVRVREKFGTDYSDFEDVEENSLSDVYDRDFHRNQTLSDHLGSDTPAGAFKTNSRHPVITGAVGVVDDEGGLIWATRRTGESDDEGLDISYSIDLLRFVLTRGVGGLAEELGELEAAETGPPLERVVRNRFVKHGPLGGAVEKEHPVGRTAAVDDPAIERPQSPAENLATRDVDIVIEEDDTHWVVEVKRKYDAGNFDHALGQVIVSEELYRQDRGVGEADTRRGLVFGGLQRSLRSGPKRQTFAEIIRLADRYDTTVFVAVEESEFVRATPDNADQIPVAPWE